MRIKKVFEKIKQTHFLIEVLILYPDVLKIFACLFLSKALKFFLNIAIVLFYFALKLLKGLSTMNQ